MMAALAPGSKIYVMNSKNLAEIRTMTSGRFNVNGVERE